MESLPLSASRCRKNRMASHNIPCKWASMLDNLAVPFGISMLAYLGTFVCSCSLPYILTSIPSCLCWLFPKVTNFSFHWFCSGAFYKQLGMYHNSSKDVLFTLSLGTKKNQHPTMCCVQMEHRCWARIRNWVKCLTLHFGESRQKQFTVYLSYKPVLPKLFPPLPQSAYRKVIFIA